MATVGDSDQFGYVSHSTLNLGDDIQSIAAKRFLPQSAVAVDREFIAQFTHGSRVRTVVNGWFMHQAGAYWDLPVAPPARSWPPSPLIDPFFISLHLTQTFQSTAFSAENIEYLHAHAPVGARDLYTLDALQAQGIPSYFSGCLTLTLPKRQARRRDVIYLVDLDQASIDCIRARTHSPVALLTHGKSILPRLGAAHRLHYAEYMLGLYRSAKCVVTTRLHAALPCLAFETPVLMISSDTRGWPNPRFSGLIEHLRHGSREELMSNELDYDFDDPPANPGTHVPLVESLSMAMNDWVGAARGMHSDSESEPGDPRPRSRPGRAGGQLTAASRQPPSRSTAAEGSESAVGVSVIYTTHRREPAFAWFADSLASQIADDAAVEVIFVDGLHGAERGAELERVVAGRFRYRHVAPKPNPWNGPHRSTAGEYAALSSARNTGIVYATNPYLVFVDDACILLEGWWQQVKRAAREGLVVGGSYQKHWEMVVRDGILFSSREEPSGLDCRWERGDHNKLVPIAGGELFGAGTAAPRSLLVELNGFDELCDPAGGEDYHLGLRIEWSGVPIYYCRAMSVVESEELHCQDPVVTRHGKSTDPSTYLRRLREFGVRRRSTDGEFDISHLVLDILHGTRSLTTMGNHFSLRTLTEEGLAGTVARLPRRHWFDDQRLSEL